MNRDQARTKLTGCYVAIPTLFRDPDLDLNLPGIRRHVRFLLEGGMREGNGVLLVCGAAGDFTTLTTEERIRVTEAILEEAGGKIGVVLGAQSTDLREVVTLAKAAERLGACAIQLSPPYYHHYTEGDVLEFFQRVADAANVGIVVYTTFWHVKMPLELIGRLIEIPNVVGLKYAAATPFEYEKGVRQFANKLCVTDNMLHFVISHMLGARGINTHPSNYWPEWGVRLWNLLEAGKYKEAQDDMNRVIVPYYDLAYDVEKFTGGEGHLDKLCMELVGLDSSRSRPPFRDIRPLFREKARKMLKDAGVPRVK